jgi:hypothetical protein
MKKNNIQKISKGHPSFRLNKARKILQAHLLELRGHYGVHALWIFGSYVRGEQYKKSDLDLLVEFERSPSLFEFVRLERHLGELLKIKVDLVMKSALKPAIGRHILEEAQSI